MTQYFYVDESGNAGLKRQASSSSHFVIAMVQLPERAPIRPLVDLRKSLNLNTGFEFKYHKTTSAQKDRFFKDVQAIPFRVRAMSLDKARIGVNLRTMSPRELTTELIIRLTLRASERDIANEILIIDGASQANCRHLRVQITSLQTPETYPPIQEDHRRKFKTRGRLAGGRHVRGRDTLACDGYL